jgi:ribosomal protein L20
MLADLAVRDAAGFTELANKVKAAIGSQQPTVKS